MPKTIAVDVPSEWRRQWPCSVLAGHHVEATLASNGDLVELNSDTDTTDLEAAELEAVLETYGAQSLGSARDLR